MTVSDNGGGADYLEHFRHALAEVRPRILFAGHTLSGSRLGEYRVQSGSKWWVYVRAPVTPHGTRPRHHRRRT